MVRRLARPFGVFLAPALVLALGLGVAAVDAPQASAQAREKPRRIVSLNLCTDQLVVLLADREAIASVTFLAADPVRSYVADRVAGLLFNYGLAEEIVALDPDFVIAGQHAARATVEMLRRLGIPVTVLPLPTSFAEIRQQIAFVAEALGEPGRGRRAIADMNATLAAARPAGTTRRRVAAIFGPNGFTGGPGSLPHAVVEAAGYQNFAEQLGFGAIGQYSVEDIVAGRPEVLIFNTDDSAAPSLARALLRHPALRKLSFDAERIDVPPKLWTCGGPYTAQAVSLLTGNGS
jgi:iron complex transport system substrate-binding protein